MIERYRKSMDCDVLHSWAQDAQREIDRLKREINALEQKWTTEPPTEPGEYWYLYDDGRCRKTSIVNLDWSGWGSMPPEISLKVYSSTEKEWDGLYLTEMPIGKWSGPIRPPEEEK